MKLLFPSSFNYIRHYLLALVFIVCYGVYGQAQERDNSLKMGRRVIDVTGLYSSKNPAAFSNSAKRAYDALPQNFPKKNENYKEDVSKRSLTSRTFIGDDGEVVIQNSYSNINYYTKEKKLEPLHTQLSAAANYWYAPEQEFPTYLYKDGSTALSDNENKVGFNAHCTINGIALNMNDYTVGEDGMYVHNVMAGVDKRMVFGENRIESDYLLHHAIAVGNEDVIITEEIDLPEGYVIEKNKAAKAEVFNGDEYVVYGQDRKVKARFHTPVFYDAHNNFKEGKYNLQKANGKTVLQIVVPNDWLNDAQRAYPVTIDPLVIGPDTAYPPLYMGSCQLPNFNSDSILITIPANITITAFIVTDSYFADMTQPGVTMNDGFIYLTTPCASTPVYSVGGTIGDTAGYAYLDSADLKSILACCFAPSCNVRTFYLAHYLARTNWSAPGCIYDAWVPPFNYIYYSPVSPWPFNAYMVGHTVETTQAQWNLFPTTVCSNVCNIDLRVTTNFGVPPYTISHPWFTGTDNYGAWGSCTSTGKDTITLTIPGCPYTCGTNSVVAVPPPVIVDVCGNTVTGLSPKNITIKPVPDATATSVSVCSGTAFIIQPNSCVPTAAFNWTGDNGTSGTGAINATVTLPGSSADTVLYTITPSTPNPNGCTGSPIVVSAFIGPPVNANIAASATSLCIPQTTTLTASGGTNYQWSGGSTSTNASITVSPAATTTYSVNVSNGICSSTDTVTVIVTPLPSTSINGSQTICSGQSITLTASGAGNYQWSGGITGNTPSITVAPTSTTTYYVSGSNPCGTSNDTIVVNVNPLPVISIINNDTIIQDGVSVPLNATGGLTYLWNFGVGLSCTTCYNPIASPQVTTIYMVTGTDANNCSSTDNVTITMIPGNHELYIPNTFTPNEDGENDVFKIYGYNINKIELFVFNRWGELIFYSDDKQKGWNGIYKDNEVEDGVYVYTVNCEWNDGSDTKRRGMVMLLR